MFLLLYCGNCSFFSPKNQDLQHVCSLLDGFIVCVAVISIRCKKRVVLTNAVVDAADDDDDGAVLVVLVLLAVNSSSSRSYCFCFHLCLLIMVDYLNLLTRCNHPDFWIASIGN